MTFFHFSGTPQFCGGISNRNGTYGSPTSCYSMTNDDPTVTFLTNVSIHRKADVLKYSFCYFLTDHIR
jgi:hypothetical protein